jgi:hypothetical protein
MAAMVAVLPAKQELLLFEEVIWRGFKMSRLPRAKPYQDWMWSYCRGASPWQTL